jgi:hypothetical protein
MAIIDILSAAQGGAFFRNVATAVGVDEAAAEKAISTIAPAIAAKLKDKASADPEAFESLLDLLEDGDGSDINDPDAITGGEALSDGKEILADLYGSPDAAHSAIAKLAPGLDTSAVSKLGAISATSVLAALAASNAQSLSTDTAQAADTGSSGGGFLSMIIAAIVKGLMQGASRQLAPKRRRRRSYSSYGYGRRRPVRRRKRSIGLDDVFREVLGGRR